MQVKKPQLEQDMEQQTSSKLRKKYVKSPCLFNFYAEYVMQNTWLYEAKAGIKIAKRNTITSDMWITPPLWQKAKKN